ncbi:MAG: T9SS type A sorting domain-containing protein [Bacteroidales bacterium]|nr:T9SS type A sorting domain-containing protein [Bacteroidales bacterium]
MIPLNTTGGNPNEMSGVVSRQQPFISRRAINLGRLSLVFILAFLSGITGLEAQVAIPDPPAGFDSYKNVPHGTFQIVEYYSGTVGINRTTRIYLPPGYTEDSTYNVLYLLHGIGGDINEWYYNGQPHYILDNLYAKGRIAPMIVVLPNGRAMVDDSPGADIFAADKVQGFADFEFELLADLIPFIDTNYSVKPGSQARAIAGLSMGGGQALDFGLAHLDTFAWVGAFSAAPNTYAADQLIPDIADTSFLSGLWLSCGDADGLLYITENTHNFMTGNAIEHYYLVEPGKGHDWSVWKPGLFHFAQRIFGTYPTYDTGITVTTNPSTGIKQNQGSSNSGLIYDASCQSVRYTGEGKIEDLKIYDMGGRLWLHESGIADPSVQIGDLPQGVYMVILFNGRRNSVGKIVKC